MVLGVTPRLVCVPVNLASLLERVINAPLVTTASPIAAVVVCTSILVLYLVIAIQLFIELASSAK
jgi:hypothetical protein